MICQIVVISLVLLVRAPLDLARFGWWCIWQLVLFIFGLDFDGFAQNPQCIVRDVATLFGLILTLGVALTISVQQGVSNQIGAVILYMVISLAILGSMVVILRTKGHQSTGHAFDRGSLMFTRFILCCSFIIVACFSGFAIADKLPGQGFDYAKAVDKFGVPASFEYEKPKKLAGITVPVVLSKDSYPKGIPSKLFMVITLDDRLKTEWEVEDVEGFIGWSPKLEEMKIRPTPYPEIEKEPGTYPWVLRDLSSDKLYTLKVHLQAKDSEAKPDFAKNLINEGKGLKVVFYSKER